MDAAELAEAQRRLEAENKKQQDEESIERRKDADDAAAKEKRIQKTLSMLRQNKVPQQVHCLVRQQLLLKTKPTSSNYPRKTNPSNDKLEGEKGRQGEMKKMKVKMM